MATTDDKVRCLECLRWFVSVAQHVQAHGLTADEYRDRHGIRRDDPLTSPELSRKRREIWERRIAEEPGYAEKLRSHPTNKGKKLPRTAERTAIFAREATERAERRWAERFRTAGFGSMEEAVVWARETGAGRQGLALRLGVSPGGLAKALQAAGLRISTRRPPRAPRTPRAVVELKFSTQPPLAPSRESVADRIARVMAAEGWQGWADARAWALEHNASWADVAERMDVGVGTVQRLATLAGADLPFRMTVKQLRMIDAARRRVAEHGSLHGIPADDLLGHWLTEQRRVAREGITASRAHDALDLLDPRWRLGRGERPRRKCSRTDEGCTEPVVGQGLCKRHYAREFARRKRAARRRPDSQLPDGPSAPS